VIASTQSHSHSLDAERLPWRPVGRHRREPSAWVGTPNDEAPPGPSRSRCHGGLTRAELPPAAARQKAAVGGLGRVPIDGGPADAGPLGHPLVGDAGRHPRSGTGRSAVPGTNLGLQCSLGATIVIPPDTTKVGILEHLELLQRIASHSDQIRGSACDQLPRP